MTTLAQVLLALSDGEYHSGEALGQALGVSRTAVWKHLQNVVELGITLDKKKGLGYRIPGGIELFDRRRILACMPAQPREQLRQLEILHSVDSTNAEARRHIERGGGGGWACVAECQSAGRGRLGRPWVSPFAKNLYLSTVWEFDGGAAAIEGLSLAVGVAVHRAITSVGVLDIGLKWPNDILRDGRKLGGILLEMTGDPVGQCQVIVGIGINVGMPADAAQAIDQAWADLAEVPDVTRNGLAAAVLSELLPVLTNYQRHTFAAYRDEWQRYDAYRGATVQIMTPGKMLEGIASGVANNGAICIDINGDVRQFSGGEISVRRLGASLTE